MHKVQKGIEMYSNKMSTMLPSYQEVLGEPRHLINLRWKKVIKEKMDELGTYSIEEKENKFIQLLITVLDLYSKGRIHHETFSEFIDKLKSLMQDSVDLEEIHFPIGEREEILLLDFDEIKRQDLLEIDRVSFLLKLYINKDFYDPTSFWAKARLIFDPTKFYQFCTDLVKNEDLQRFVKSVLRKYQLDIELNTLIEDIKRSKYNAIAFEAFYLYLLNKSINEKTLDFFISNVKASDPSGMDKVEKILKIYEDSFANLLKLSYLQNYISYRKWDRYDLGKSKVTFNFSPEDEVRLKATLYVELKEKTSMKEFDIECFIDSDQFLLFVLGIEKALQIVESIHFALINPKYDRAFIFLDKKEKKMRVKAPSTKIRGSIQRVFCQTSGIEAKQEILIEKERENVSEVLDKIMEVSKKFPTKVVASIKEIELLDNNIEDLKIMLSSDDVLESLQRYQKQYDHDLRKEKSINKIIFVSALSGKLVTVNFEKGYWRYPPYIGLEEQRAYDEFLKSLRWVQFE